MLTTFFIWISDFGHGPFYFSLAFFLLVRGWFNSYSSAQNLNHLFWLGWRLSLFWMVGVLLNTFLKFSIMEPRPWWINKELLPLHPQPAKGFGMPSGHMQSAMGIFWLSYWYSTHKKRMYQNYFLNKIFIFGAVSWCILIGASRIYLHAHSFIQVINGAFLGSILGVFISWIENHKSGFIILSFMILLLTVGCFWQFFYPLSDLSQAIVFRLQEYKVAVPLRPSIKVISFFSLSSIIGAVVLKWKPV